MYSVVISLLPLTFCIFFNQGQALIGSDKIYNLGRYWPVIGPQVRLYVPKPFLHQGSNSVIMLELETAPCQKSIKCVVSFVDQPLINGTTKCHDIPLHWTIL